MKNLKKEIIEQIPILIASENKGKAEEIKQIFEGSPYKLYFLFDFPEKLKEIEIQENARSFEGNALIKALICGNIFKMPCLADDSGLCVDALNGAPGVYSARYAKKGDDLANNDKLLKALEAVPDDNRLAHYNCTVAFFNPFNLDVETIEALWFGKIAKEAKGANSFGYAPIFLPQDFNYSLSSAELELKDIVKINHRFKAFNKALSLLNTKFIQ